MHSGDKINFNTKKDPTAHYYSIALNNYFVSSELESIDNYHSFRNNLSCCIFSFMVLESTIWSIYFDGVNKDLETEYQYKPVLQGELLTRRQKFKKMNIEEKYNTILKELHDFTFNERESPFILFKEFVRFRNMLVHPESTYTTTHIEITDISESNWSGELIDEYSTSQRSTVEFQTTGFANNFSDISIQDCQKALEIVYIMRRVLIDNNIIKPLILCLDRNNNLTYESEDIIKDLFVQHFL